MKVESVNMTCRTCQSTWDLTKMKQNSLMAGQFQGKEINGLFVLCQCPSCEKRVLH